MKNEIRTKIESCKALQGKTVLDVVGMPKFRENLAGYWNAQVEDRKDTQKSYAAMYKMGTPKGFKLPSHVIDRLMDLSVEDMVTEFAAILGRVSTRPHAEREYIRQLGQQAYNLTIAQIVCDEFPELHDYFYPKAN